MHRSQDIVLDSLGGDGMSHALPRTRVDFSPDANHTNGEPYQFPNSHVTWGSIYFEIQTLRAFILISFVCFYLNV